MYFCQIPKIARSGTVTEIRQIWVSAAHRNSWRFYQWSYQATRAYQKPGLALNGQTKKDPIKTLSAAKIFLSVHLKMYSEYKIIIFSLKVGESISSIKTVPCEVLCDSTMWGTVWELKWEFVLFNSIYNWKVSNQFWKSDSTRETFH